MPQIDLHEQVQPEECHQIGQMPIELDPALQEFQQQNGSHGRPYLYEDCIGRDAYEGLDPQYLFDVLEEDLDVPAGLIQLRDRICCPGHFGWSGRQAACRYPGL